MSPNGNESIIPPFKDVVKSFIAGGIAGTSEILVMYPLDVVKTREQLAVGKVPPVIPHLQQIVKNEGVRALYRGILVPILNEAPKRATKFMANQIYLRALTRNTDVTWYWSGMAGGLAGATEAFINCPAEVIKIRMQAAGSPYKNSLECASHLVKTEGALSLWKGIGPQIWRNGSWNGSYFGLAFVLKKHFLWQPDSKQSELLRNFTAGCVGGAVATTFNTPFDVVKSRVQNAAPGAPKPWTLVALRDIANAEGVSALYKGYVPRLMRLAPGGGIMLFVYDFVIGYLKDM